MRLFFSVAGSATLPFAIRTGDDAGPAMRRLTDLLAAFCKAFDARAKP
jgi:hypothetical protein